MLSPSELVGCRLGLATNLLCGGIEITTVFTTRMVWVWAVRRMASRRRVCLLEWREYSGEGMCCGMRKYPNG
jgi:hypothetical protein